MKESMTANAEQYDNDSQDTRFTMMSLCIQFSVSHFWIYTESPDFLHKSDLMTLFSVSYQLIHKPVQVTLTNEFVRVLITQTPAQYHWCEAAM